MSLGEYVIFSMSPLYAVGLVLMGPSLQSGYLRKGLESLDQILSTYYHRFILPMGLGSLDYILRNLVELYTPSIDSQRLTQD